MFTKYIQAAVWTEHTAEGDADRDFRALYVFDDGFTSLEEAVKKIELLGHAPQEFVYVSFCGQWYAEMFRGSLSCMIVTAEGVYGKESPYQLGFHSLSAEETGAFKVLLSPNEDAWYEGFVRDLTIADMTADVFYCDGCRIETESLYRNHALTLLGMLSFRSQVCIRAKDYWRHVFLHYYDIKNLGYLEREFNLVLSRGYEYYNPFTGDMSRDEEEKDRKQNAFLKEHGLSVGDVIVRPNLPNRARGIEWAMYQDQETRIKKLEFLKTSPQSKILLDSGLRT